MGIQAGNVQEMYQKMHARLEKLLPDVEIKYKAELGKTQHLS